MSLTKKINDNWITIGRTLQSVADFQIYKAKEDKRNKQMLWKGGARRFKFK